MGGVYNKVAAAAQAGKRFALVPDATYSGKSKLYLLIQTEFGIPLVQAANIVQASVFAFTPGINVTSHQFAYNVSTNYSVDNLPEASATCSNQCNESAFAALANYTIANTRDAIGLLGGTKFGSISQQLSQALGQSAQTMDRGYFYTAANEAFLDYLNAEYFDAHDTTKSQTLSSLENTETFCSSLVQPQFTTNNYEYLMGAELRQEWGTYTINQTLSSYNTSATDTDTVLNEVYVGTEAKGWCNAAGFTYGYFASSTGTPITFAPALSSIAMDRLNRDVQYGYPGMYYDVAQQAYKSNNYPLAILGADYDFAISNSSIYGDTASTQQLLSAAQALAQDSNSTYGVWATEFAKEAQFYAYEAGESVNSTQAHSNAVEAYTSALLAQHVGSDMKLIYQNGVPSTSSGTGTPLQNSALIEIVAQLEEIEKLVVMVLVFAILTFAAVLTMIAILIKRSASKQNRREVRRKAPKVTRRRAARPNKRRRRR